MVNSHDVLIHARFFYYQDIKKLVINIWNSKKFQIIVSFLSSFINLDFSKYESIFLQKLHIKIYILLYNINMNNNFRINFF